jgi:non-specific protein-tyrosine kinase
VEFAGNLRLLLVTSANPLEGKTTTAAHLGSVIAQEGKRVILVDADLRHPTLHSCFGIPNSEGLSNCLVSRNRSPVSLLQTTELDGLKLLSAGTNLASPSILLRSDRLTHIFQELGAEADVVIVDSAPLLVATDAMTLASKVEDILLVVAAGATQRRSAIEAVRMVRSVNGNVLGVVLNRVNPGAALFRQYDRYYATNRKSHSDKAKPGGSRKQRRSLLGFGSER